LGFPANLTNGNNKVIGDEIMRFIIRAILGITIIGFILTACSVPYAPRLVSGSGEIVVEERDVSGFDKILISGAGRVIVTQGDAESLTVETDDNLMKYIETKVVGDTLEIGFTEGTVLSPGGGRRVLEPSQGFIFRIGVADLSAVTLSGAARFEMDKLKTDGLDILLSGAGDIQIDDLNASRLDLQVSGAGDVSMAGSVESQDVRLSGLGKYQAFALESKTAAVFISGAGGADLWVTDDLGVTISGAGDVKYYGSPVVSPEISGLGRIQGLGDK
jgi:hypothetical protein